MPKIAVIAAVAAALCAATPRPSEAGVSRGLGLAPSLPSLEPVTASEMASGLRSGLSGDRDGKRLETPLAVADALRNAKCVALFNLVSGSGGAGSIRQEVNAEQVVMNCH